MANGNQEIYILQPKNFGHKLRNIIVNGEKNRLLNPLILWPNLISPLVGLADICDSQCDAIQTIEHHL